MIPFFRKIRKQMADDNKPMKYMRYAIGEILLVVIGILIALSINNWNEERQLKNLEKEYLLGLKRDFKLALEGLDKSINIGEKSIKSTDALLRHISSPTIVLNNFDFVMLAGEAHQPALIYKASTGTFEDLVSSGNLKTISNKSLRMLLSDWKQKYTEVQEMQQLVLRSHSSLRNYLVDKFDFRIPLVEAYKSLPSSEKIEIPELPPSKFKNISLDLLNSKTYENYLAIYMIEVYSLNEGNYKPLRVMNEKLLDLINSELEK